jgi:hypothetical protein
MAYTLRVDHAKLQSVGMDEARKRVRRVMRGTFNRSQVLCPVDTGNLRATGRLEPIVQLGGLIRGGVRYDADYAAAVHNGRRALTIRPRRPGGKLKFTVGGRTVYARQVRQPARAGRPFLTTALAEVASREGFTVVRVG